jgi:pyruvate dehydrogenase E2 component (dihydrolipoamide acetyltransferase)
VAKLGTADAVHGRHDVLVRQGRIEPRRALTASLAIDHQVSGGHRGALFLAVIDRLLQEPETL